MTSAIRKMTLIPAELAQQQAEQQQITQPAVVRLNQLDEEMKQVLDSRFPSDVKFKLYNHILRQHDQVSDRMKKPVEVEIKKEEIPREKKEFPVAQMMREIPQKKQQAATLLIDHMYQNGFDFNDKKELVVNGQAIRDSNIIDLFNYANRDMSRAPPVGWNEYHTLLRRTNAPAAAITNRRLVAAPQIGRGIKWESIYK